MFDMLVWCSEVLTATPKKVYLVLWISLFRKMVQGEINTVVSPGITTNNTNKFFDANNNVGSNKNNNSENNNNDSTGEKKKKVGNYIISKTIGEGSFAKVRLGYHLITQQMVMAFLFWFKESNKILRLGNRPVSITIMQPITPVA